MGYYVTNMIGIHTWHDEINLIDMKLRIHKIVVDMERDEEVTPSFDEEISSMSQELKARKGNLVVIGGIFNYWKFEHSRDFASRLSKEFKTEVMIMAYDHERDTTECAIFSNGKPVTEPMTPLSVGYAEEEGDT